MEACELLELRRHVGCCGVDVTGSKSQEPPVPSKRVCDRARYRFPLGGEPENRSGAPVLEPVGTGRNQYLFTPPNGLSGIGCGR